MKIKKLVTLIMVITAIITAIFTYLYFSVSDPKQVIGNTITTIQGIDPAKQPKFLFAINNEPSHPLGSPEATLVVNKKIFVSDSGNPNVLMFDYNGKLERNLKPGEDRFKAPYGLAFDGSVLFVADAGAGRIYLFSPEGDFIKVFGNKEKLGTPGVLQFHDGKLYVSDLSLHKVLVFDTGGNLLSSYGKEGNGNDQLYFPHGFTIDNKGVIYVADSGNNRIQVFKPDGSVGENKIGQLSTPRGMYGDQNGNLWIVEGLANRVSVYKTDGTKTTDIGTKGEEYGKLSLPNGVYIDQNYRLYITEFGNSRVSVFSY